MTVDTARNLRGWMYAGIVAICLLLIFFAGENYSRMKQPGYYHEPRTSNISISTSLKHIPRIATEEMIPLSIEPIASSIDQSVWINYRSEAASSIALIEPPAGVKLSAPIAPAMSDPAWDPQRRQSQSWIALQTESIPASNVSTIKATEPIKERDRLATDVHTSAIANPNAWPIATELTGDVDKLAAIATTRMDQQVQDWALEIRRIYDALRNVSITDPVSTTLLHEWGTMAEKGAPLANELSLDESTRDLALMIARVMHAVERRRAVWTSVHECVRSRSTLVSARHHTVDSESLQRAIVDVKGFLKTTGDADAWHRYLMLDAIAALTLDEAGKDREQARLVREFLSRVTDPKLSEVQRGILTSKPVHRLADAVHPLSIGPVDYHKLLVDIETVESDPVHRSGHALADSMQSLRFSEYPEQTAVSQAISTHYRNANLRMSVSEEFINRMMPKPTLIERPVRQTILGADTRGASNVATKLRADFLPDPNGWKVALDLDGDINSDTRSSRNGATFYNSSIATVNARRVILIDPQGMRIDGEPTQVNSNDALKTFSTDWDSLPIFGDMVRHFAHEKFLSSRPIAKRMMQKIISKQTDDEFDSQLQSKIANTKKEIDQRLIGPLQSFDLHPMVVDMQTTDTRMVVRYRVASTDQIAAYTPRPLAPSDSQLSLQIHQSAFNNLVGQIVTGDREWTTQELSDKIADAMQQPRRPVPADTPTDIAVRFADLRPITMEFEDGKMWLTLRIKTLEQPGRLHLKNFTIRTSYAPVIDGLKASLERDGTISVEGRDRLALRAIFSKVFASCSTIPMVSQGLIDDPRAHGLAVSQLEMRDGWLAIAVSNGQSPHVAKLKQILSTR